LHDIAFHCIDGASHQHSVADDDAFGEFLSSVSDQTSSQQSTVLPVETSSCVEDGLHVPDSCDSGVSQSPVEHKQAGVEVVALTETTWRVYCIAVILLLLDFHENWAIILSCYLS